MYRVKESCVLGYGYMTHVKVKLKKGQKWEYIKKSGYMFHTLRRDNVTLEVNDEDFENIFVKEEKNHE